MPATLMAFAPVTPAEWGLFTVTLVLAATALATAHRIYRHGPALTYLAALCISWIPVQALAFVAERRMMWLPGQHSAVFFWGDSVALPLAAVGLCLVRREWWRQNPGPGITPIADTRWWRAIVVTLAIAISIGFHWSQVVSWDPESLHAPSKVWHDYFVYPVFLYLLGSQLPFLWQVRWWSRPRQVAWIAAVAAGALGWLLLGHVYDPAHAHDRRPLLIIASVSHISSPLSVGPSCRVDGCGPH